MKRPLKSLIASFTLLSLAVGCAVPSVDVAPRYGQMELDGTYSLVREGVIETADLNTAGFDVDKDYLGARIDLDMGVPVLTVLTQTTNHGGPGLLAGNLDEIGSGAAVVAALDLGLHSLLMTWDVIPTDYIDIGIGIGATVIDFDASITEDRGSESSITADEIIPLPVLAIRARLEVGDFRLGVLLSGIDIDLGSDSASFYDLDAMAEYRLIGGKDRMSGSIGLGYRSTSMDFEYQDGADDIDVEIDLNGPYIALMFSF
jgi:hypothetical protein